MNTQRPGNVLPFPKARSAPEGAVGMGRIEDSQRPVDVPNPWLASAAVLGIAALAFMALYIVAGRPQ